MLMLWVRRFGRRHPVIMRRTLLLTPWAVRATITKHGVGGRRCIHGLIGELTGPRIAYHVHRNRLTRLLRLLLGLLGLLLLSLMMVLLLLGLLLSLLQ